MNPEEFEEWIALESVGALSPAEAARLEEALAAHPEWKARAHEMREVAARLAWAAAPCRPSAECKHRLLEALRQRTAAETESAATQAVADGSGAGWLPWAVAALVLAMASWGVIGGFHRPAQVASQQIVLMHLRAAQPGSPAIADVAWDCATGCGSLCAQHMPVAPQGHCYQIWVMAPGHKEPVSGGVFTVAADGTAEVMVHPEEPMLAANKILVSLEVAGGVRHAQGPAVLESI